MHFILSRIYESESLRYSQSHDKMDLDRLYHHDTTVVLLDQCSLIVNVWIRQIKTIRMTAVLGIGGTKRTESN